LLAPSRRTASGYRLYTSADLTRLSQVIVYRRLELSLDEIASLLDQGNEVSHLVRQRERVMSRLDETERGPSVLDQRHRAVIMFHYQLPYNITVGTVTQVASARPVNSTTGVDNNGDGSTNDRPVIDGKVIGKSAFRGTGTQDISLFLEGRIKRSGRTILLRLEAFNLANHGNLLGRGVTTYGDGGTPAPTFGQFAGNSTTTAIPAFANIDPPRMFQFQVRFVF